MIWPFRMGVCVLPALASVLCAACAPARAPQPLPLRAMSYNIAAGNGDLERVADVIRAAGADIVALQEVDVHWSERSSWADQAAELGAMLEMNVRFGPIYRLPGERGSPADSYSGERDVQPREFGLAILSRHPIVEFRNHVIPRLSTQADDVEPRPLPGFLEAVVRVRGVRIHVFNTHLDYRSDPRVREAQVAAMLPLLPDRSLPVILMGDLNAPPHAAELAPLFTRLNDAGRRDHRPGHTYPAATPERRIDYVLYSDRFAVRAASVMDTRASDHRPVIADLVVMVSGAPVSQWKGNLHTHSVWSDGTDYPEMIVDWYHSRGYDFLALTEHDMLQEGDRWVDINAEDAGWPPRNQSSRRALPGYLERFGTDWVQQHNDSDRHLVRLRPLAEYRHLFEQPGRFLLLTGEEITDREGAHVNAFNLNSAILPRGGTTGGERIRNNLAAVAEQRSATGRAIVAIVNHPNYVWALTAEELASIPDVRMFEVFNGHKLVNNAGNAEHAGTERMWDIALSLRHAAGLPPFFAVASDDAHDYRDYSAVISRPGRGWVMVRAPRLTSDDVAHALRTGDFYASTGVTLRSERRDERRDERRIRVEIDAEPGVTYRTQIIGTRRDVPLTSRPVLGADGDTLRTTRSYDERVGEVLAEIQGTSAEYVFRGDERYARAKVISSRPHIDPTTGDTLGVQMAWLQPVFR